MSARTAALAPVLAPVLALTLALGPGGARADEGATGFPVRLSSCATEYDPSVAGRAWNVALAARRLDGVVLAPGEPLAFNERVGARGLGEGFREAPELVSGERVAGLGGGACQVASTLYGAALDAGLPIRARAAHSRPVDYAPPGRDATVSAEQGIDLRVANDLPCRVLVRARAAKGRLVVSLWSEREPGRRVSVSIERRAMAGDVAPGMRPALEVTTWRTITRTVTRAGAGSPAPERELVARDEYLSAPLH